ncbi:hypothetical protein [Streptacidiphilus rugosus]|uniref:hypothetical protein n=1 Tax=Streptacidiphilus rugosus TaxID=405783 RepID=UPI000ACCCC70|nr:hypothetical protein [Streptacidiphilus rugosus]
MRALVPVFCVGGLLAGCASSPSSPPPSLSVRPTDVGRTAPVVAGNAAAQLLADFLPPPGAVRLSGEPSGAPRPVDRPAMSPTADQLQIATSWWSVTGTPEQAQTWFAAHGPAGSTPGGSADGTGVGGVVALTRSFTLPDQAGYQERTLMMTAVAFHRATLLRVDAMEVHVGVRSAHDRIPAGVVRLVVRATTAAAPESVVLRTVTDAGTIRQVAAMTDALPLLAPGVRNCPNDRGGTLRLDFYTAASTAPAASLIAAHSGCQTATITTTEAFAPTNLNTATTDYQARVLALLQVTFPAG